MLKVWQDDRKSYFRRMGAYRKLIQLDLDGYQIPYQCKRCKLYFSTMSELKIHHATHRKYSKTKVTISFALENFCLISTKKVEVISK